MAMGILMTLLLSRSRFYTTEGPYGVGYREFKLSRGKRARVSVYYPIDKDFYDQHQYDPAYNVPKMVEGLKVATGTAIAFKVSTHFLFRYYVQWRVQAIKNHELHKDFTDGNKKLLPIIFSHGLFTHRNAHSVILRELAAHGCIVYSVNHTDGSGAYYPDESGHAMRDVFFTDYTHEIPATKGQVSLLQGIEGSNREMTEQEFREMQQKLRMRDIEALLEYLKHTEAKEIPTIDLKNLVAAGQSMGGTTAMEGCRRFEDDFKYCLVMDPYLRSCHEAIEQTKDFYK